MPNSPPSISHTLPLISSTPQVPEKNLSTPYHCNTFSPTRKPREAISNTMQHHELITVTTGKLQIFKFPHPYPLLRPITFPHPHNPTNPQTPIPLLNTRRRKTREESKYEIHRINSRCRRVRSQSMDLSIPNRTLRIPSSMLRHPSFSE